MRAQVFLRPTLALLVTLGAARFAAADPDTIDLVLHAGRPLRVALDHKVSVKRVGQPVTGTVVAPVYAYDRLVIPAGTSVRGHVVQLLHASRASRWRGYLRGDFSPPRQVMLQFDALILDGHEVPIETVVTGGIPNVKAATAHTKPGASGAPAAPDDAPGGVVSTMRHQATETIASAKAQARDALATVTQSGKLARLKDALVGRLPFHPQYLAQGLVYDVTLVSPVSFGSVVPTPRAPLGTPPAPDSVLAARLVTSLDSSKTPRGTPLAAVVTEPVFSADHELILPEGTTLTGEVTQATQARRFHRNGRLRFLIEGVQPPDRSSMSLRGALYSVQASGDDHVAVDDEGGTTLSNPKTRLIAPALGLLALRAALTHEGGDGDGPTRHEGGDGGHSGLGGFLGFGVVGFGLAHLSQPVGIALSVVGAARTFYTHILGKGREVSFAADTPIQVRLAPGPTPAP